MATVANMLLLVQVGECDIGAWFVPLGVLWCVHAPVSITAAVGLHLVALTSISDASNLPVFRVLCNIYVDGVYDLCHIGHMIAFENAKKYGHRLYVGICSDEDVARYKRNPIMTTEERAQVVRACNHVHGVILNAPCQKGFLNEKFIDEHNIHIVCLGEEYDNPEDLWYAIPRRLGMVRILPRYNGLSTSDLLRRIRSRMQDNTL